MGEVDVIEKTTSISIGYDPPIIKPMATIKTKMANQTINAKGNGGTIRIKRASKYLLRLKSE